ncbi:MAG: phytanoyl-CoA dioxygenase family protein [Thiolinea sp.]
MTYLTPQQLEKYQQDGYLIIDTEPDHTLLNNITHDLTEVWGNKEITSIPVAQDNRIQGGWKISDNVYQLAVHKPVLNALEQLYQSKPLPFQTLNFRRGTQQMVHSDSLHFNSEPFGMMCGVWFALEDIGMDQGPLVFYPGSQQWPEMNFPDMKLKIGDFQSYRHYIKDLVAEKQLEPAYGVMKKGQALIWQANLLHGGLEQHDKSLSRHSQVTHFYFENCRYWRPSLSKTERHYFKPDWIPLTNEVTESKAQPTENNHQASKSSLKGYIKGLFSSK